MARSQAKASRKLVSVHTSAPARARVWLFLNERQRDELSKHLDSISGMDVESTIEMIDAACFFAKHNPEVPAPKIRKWIAEYTQIRRAASKLVPLLSVHDFPKDLAIRIIEDLENLIRLASARERSCSFWVGGGRGRKSIIWRDDLIALVFGRYPRGAAKKSVGSHFEQTIEMILGYLNKEVSDVHGVIVDALRRRTHIKSEVAKLGIFY